MMVKIGTLASAKFPVTIPKSWFLTTGRVYKVTWKFMSIQAFNLNALTLILREGGGSRGKPLTSQRYRYAHVVKDNLPLSLCFRSLTFYTEIPTSTKFVEFLYLLCLEISTVVSKLRLLWFRILSQNDFAFRLFSCQLLFVGFLFQCNMSKYDIFLIKVSTKWTSSKISSSFFKIFELFLVSLCEISTLSLKIFVSYRNFDRFIQNHRFFF